MSEVESSIQDRVIKYLRGRGAYVRNIPGSSATGKGTADLLVCYRGLFLAIELKKPDGSYGETKPQEIRRRQVTRAGGLALVARSLADVVAIIAQIDEEERCY